MCKYQDALPSRPMGGFFLPLKRFIAIVLIVCATLFVWYSPSRAAVEKDLLLEAGRTAVIDTLIQNAIRRGLISGAVVLVGNHAGTLYVHAAGKALSLIHI